MFWVFWVGLVGGGCWFGGLCFCLWGGGLGHLSFGTRILGSARPTAIVGCCVAFRSWGAGFTAPRLSAGAWFGQVDRKPPPATDRG